MKYRAAEINIRCVEHDPEPGRIPSFLAHYTISRKESGEAALEQVFGEILFISMELACADALSRAKAMIDLTLPYPASA